MPIGPLPAGHVVADILVSMTRRKSVAIRFVAQLPIEVSSAHDQLDAFLRELARGAKTSIGALEQE
jgi:hypothetical protein